MSRTIDYKKYCNIMVGMEIRTPQLLPPFIIFSGGFCKMLMKKSQNSLNDYNALVTFTDKHCQTE